MSTILADDPIIGIYAYEGTMETISEGLRVYHYD